MILIFVGAFDYETYSYQENWFYSDKNMSK